MSSEIPVTPPKDDEFETEPAPRPGFWRRVLCYLLDIAVLLVVVGCINHFLLGIVPPPDPESLPEGALPPAPSNAEFVSSAFFAFLYFGLMHGRFGKTLGKMAGGIRVVDMMERPIGYCTAFVRAFWSMGILALLETPRFFFPESSFVWLSDAGAMYIIFNCLAFVWDQKYNRALHDRLAGTRVVMREK